MKILKKISLIFLGILFLQSCTKDQSFKNLEQIQDNQQYQITTSDTDKKEILVSMGFSEENIEEYNEYFLVENDIVIYKNAIKYDDTELSNPTPSSRQRRSTILVSGCNVANIRVLIDPNFDANWTGLIQQAMTAWNNAGSSVFFTAVNMNPDITIFRDDSPSCPASHRNLRNTTCGRGTFPLAGRRAGDIISINIDNAALNNNAKRLRTITHEFGHNIGIRHTNQGGGVHIHGTPNRDNESVMNAGECGQEKTLSLNDRRSVKKLYPDNPQLSGPGPMVSRSFTSGYFSFSGLPAYDTALWTSASSGTNLTIANPTSRVGTTISGFTPNNMHSINIQLFCGGNSMGTYSRTVITGL